MHKTNFVLLSILLVGGSLFSQSKIYYAGSDYYLLAEKIIESKYFNSKTGQTNYELNSNNERWQSIFKELFVPFSSSLPQINMGNTVFCVYPEFILGVRVTKDIFGKTTLNINSFGFKKEKFQCNKYLPQTKIGKEYNNNEFELPQLQRMSSENEMTLELLQKKNFPEIIFDLSADRTGNPLFISYNQELNSLQFWCIPRFKFSEGSKRKVHKFKLNGVIDLNMDLGEFKSFNVKDNLYLINESTIYKVNENYSGLEVVREFNEKLNFRSKILIIDQSRSKVFVHEVNDKIDYKSLPLSTAILDGLIDIFEY